MKILLLFTLVLLSFALTVSASTTKTGEDLPDFVKAAIKAANKKYEWTNPTLNSKVVVEDNIALDQVVIIYDMIKFCEGLRVSEKDCSKLGQAFVIEHAYPIYINADKKTPSNYDQIESIYFQAGKSDIKYFLAGALAHENVHAQGEASEYLAYSRELGFLDSHKDEIGKTWWFNQAYSALLSYQKQYKGSTEQLKVLSKN